ARRRWSCRGPARSRRRASTTSPDAAPPGVAASSSPRDVLVQRGVEVADPALLVAAERQARPRRGPQTPLDAGERGAVLVEDPAEDAELGHVAPRLVGPEDPGRGGRRALAPLGD